MTNYNDGKWHGWNGGECPVHPETVVEVIHVLSGKLGERRAAITSWRNPHLVAFRVIKEHREPHEVWAVNVPNYGWTVCEAGFEGAKLFREVIE